MGRELEVTSCETLLEEAKVQIRNLTEELKEAQHLVRRLRADRFTELRLEAVKIAASLGPLSDADKFQELSLAIFNFLSKNVEKEV